MIKPTLALIPSGYKGGSGLGKVYSILPNNGDGDFDYERNGNATRVRKDGLIEELTVDDTPRLDWLDSNCPSLKLEPQSTNKVTYSEDFTNASWSNFRLSVNSDSILSPKGDLTSDFIFENTDTGTHAIQNGVSVTNGLTYTYSFFAKKGNRKLVGLLGSSPAQGAIFDLENGVIFSDLIASPNSKKIENYGNGWYRCSITTTFTGVSETNFGIYLADDLGSINYTGDGTSGLYIWGAQLEEQLYVTSYIKTEGGTSTRFVDNCHLLNQTLFTDYPFTVYAKAKVEEIGNVVFSLIDSTVSNKYLSFYFASSIQVGVLRRDASNNDSDFYNFTPSILSTLGFLSF